MKSASLLRNKATYIGAQERVAVNARREIMLFELGQVMWRLHQSDRPEPICGTLERALEPFIDLGLIAVMPPEELGDPITVTRVCPPSMLLHYFWGAWLPDFYRSLEGGKS